ncbi:hypothetical protein DPMN_127846 [Dreissena polymorpha]|uniref:Uncharacterized protein n=1 Tax=Dreissena polymorpha TaxID=45954 RepID=A0A9D4H2S1_DREPO|nr:hypothetical protein DPMN_127846 [Dreissena polymorpha]
MSLIAIGAQIVKTGFNRFTRRVSPLRMRDMNRESGQEVSLKGVGKGTTLELQPFSINDIGITVNASDQLKPSLLVNHSPKEIAELQWNDTDVGCIIRWMEEGLQPSRNAIVSHLLFPIYG